MEIIKINPQQRIGPRTNQKEKMEKEKDFGVEKIESRRTRSKNCRPRAVNEPSDTGEGLKVRLQVKQQEKLN